MNTLQAILHVLTNSGKAMHYKEIAQKIIEDGLTEWLQWETPWLSVNATITRHINRYWEESPFTRVTPGVYILSSVNNKEQWSLFVEVLSEENQESEILEVDEDESNESIKNEQNTSRVNTQFVWKAWELAVCSELLMRWRNANILFVDDGIDIVALKNKKKYHIQVKTSARPSTASDGQVYHFSIWRSAFDRYQWWDIFYVFVARTSEENNSFVVMNFFHLSNLIAREIIRETNASWKWFWVHIKFHYDGNVSINWEIINEHVNNWTYLYE